MHFNTPDERGAAPKNAKIDDAEDQAHVRYSTLKLGEICEML